MPWGSRSLALAEQVGKWSMGKLNSQEIQGVGPFRA